MQISFIFCIGNANFFNSCIGNAYLFLFFALAMQFILIFCIGNSNCFYFWHWECNFFYSLHWQCNFFLLFNFEIVLLFQSFKPISYPILTPSCCRCRLTWIASQISKNDIFLDIRLAVVQT